ncbi:Serine/threonine protein kinase [Streptomyces sp. yr375]|uniref:serine/threonine protein kinase n=1 Tax=Streptomyces sp. yr375 TaxID=1761906 RepID=UPI0008B92EDB|nr:serine/threonine protein kinase [Streptomyces sp. yr375]SES48142.1 Serine/threonine protein kinase [Streptomyces sp. yr375]
MSDEGRLIAGRYRILDRIGRGGMATVWRAHDHQLGRQVAVKKLHPQPHLDDDELATLFERARREAHSAARISHPNVVVVHDVVDDEGLPTIVMEYVPSTTLADRITAHGPVPLEEVARIGRGVIGALRAAHRAGVLHRDVKPANVLLAEDGRVVLTDFGIAQASETSNLTRTGQLVGSVDFMAPERLVGATPGPEADLWALGATLFQAVEGRSPFLRNTVAQTMYAIAMEPPPEVRGAGTLTPLIQGLLASRPAERLSAEDAERLLRLPARETDPAAVAPTTRATADNAVRPQPATTDLRVRRPPGRRSRKKAVWVAAAVATALLVAVAALIAVPLEQNGTSATASDGAHPAAASTTPPTDTDPSASATSPADPAPSARADATLPPSTAVQEDSEPKSGATVPPVGGALVVAASGKCLSGGGGTEGLQLFQATCDGSAAQRWETGSGGTLRSSGKCMTVAGGATADRTEIRLTGCDGGTDQRFHLAGTRLMADQSQKCVDIFGGASGTGAVLWECNGRDNQTWTLR